MIRWAKKENKLYKQENNYNMANSKKVYIAGGCFWGMEDLFRTRKGIVDTEVGYIGGENENPTYGNHPGHAEGIEITYDTAETDFKEIVDYFSVFTILLQLTDKVTIEARATDQLFFSKMTKKNK